jgi:long-chain acyl-CoA synthetase
MYGMMFEFLFEMAMGCHVHFLTRLPSPKVILGAFQDIKPCIMISVPLIIEKVYRNILKPVLDRNKIFFKVPILNKALEKKIRAQLVSSFGGNFEEIILGGAAMNPEVEKFFHKIKFPFTIGYGMTECAPIIAYEHWDKTRIGSCGKAADNMEIRIDSSDPQKVAGEVLVRGANVFLGYYKNEKATAEAFTDDGWFRTGDMGVLDSDGYLYLRGRCKCMILGPSGQNIYPEELEAVINNVTYVLDSLVVEEQNGSLTAIVYPDYNLAAMDGMTPEQLQDRLTQALPEINKQIPNYAQIKKMEFLREDFERTPKKSIKRFLYQRK